MKICCEIMSSRNTIEAMSMKYIHHDGLNKPWIMMTPVNILAWKGKSLWDLIPRHKLWAMGEFWEQEKWFSWVSVPQLVIQYQVVSTDIIHIQVRLFRLSRLYLHYFIYLLHYFIYRYIIPKYIHIYVCV